jgi:primary-amine oxidase
MPCVAGFARNMRRVRLPRLCAAAVVSFFTTLACGADHPLDPLDKAELQTAVDVLKASGKVNSGSSFPLIELREPPKEEVLTYQPGTAFRREAFAVVYERAANRTYEAVVDVKDRKLISWKNVPGVQPSFLEDDALILQQAVRADPRWQEAMRRRGITNFHDVEIEDWAVGYFGSPETDGLRVRAAVSRFIGEPRRRMGRDIAGVVAYVDLSAKKVVKFIDAGQVPIPNGTPGFSPEAIGKTREAPKPLHISQPAGPSFEVRGHEIRWQKWRLRYSMNAREGLVLSMVGYEDQGRVRPVLYRGSLSEMVVPYGDPAPDWYIKNAFDMGEDSMGRYAVPLEPLTDAPANATFLDAVFADEKGHPINFPRAAMLYERDGGLLWMHYPRGGLSASRRGRELVLGWIAGVGNYDYAFSWVFHQDGTLGMEVELAGFMDTKAVRAASALADDPALAYGRLVAPNIDAVYHQHFFCFRLDLDVDGAGNNSVMEMNTESAPADAANPERNAFVMKETLFHTEGEAVRLLNLASSRHWKVVNTSVKNALGQPVAYMLVPGENSVPYAAPDSQVRKRTGFMDAHLWVTPYDPNEIYAAGFYANQNLGEDTVAQWVTKNRSIENQDVVLWYTMGITHMPRPEDWPIMPVHHAGFQLMPVGFFDRNPALDVPKPQ